MPSLIRELPRDLLQERFQRLAAELDCRRELALGIECPW